MTDRPSALNRFEKPALVVGIVGLVLSAIGGFLQPPHFFQAYLVAYIFWASIALGSIALLAIQYLTGGVWGVLIRRPLESAAKTLPLLLIGFVPIFLGMRHLYSWSRHDVMEHDVLLQKKAAYLNVPFFSARTIVFFILWIAIGYLLTKWDREYEDTGNPRLILRIRKVSAAALLIMTLTLTFASVDWMMSLEPHWYSTIFGVYFFAGSVVAVFATLILLALAARPALGEVVTAEHFHDLGKLLFAFVVFWAYIAFSQFMLIWYGNLPEETIWFAHRLEHGWEPVTVALVLGHFVIPFFFLLSRGAKRNRIALAVAAVWMLVVHAVDVYWLVMPAVERGGFHFLWVDLLNWIAVGGLALGALGLLARRRALVPVADPRLPESLSFENM